MEKWVNGCMVLDGILFVRERAEMSRGSVEARSSEASKASSGRA